MYNSEKCFNISCRSKFPIEIYKVFDTSDTDHSAKVCDLLGQFSDVRHHIS